MTTVACNPDPRWYADAALHEIPRLLTLLDRDPSSPTYGCFDRNYWHYRTQDFPSGMYQELALPLAQAAVLDLPGNRWYGRERIRELALAAIDYAARSAHADGSCDDYYPYERALGATAFVAAAHAEVLRLTGDRKPERLEALAKRARWLTSHQETGRLSNHQALVALAAARTAALTDDDALRRAVDERLGICLEWQHDEGWFHEYEGADAGYQSLTIAFLANLRDVLPSAAIDQALRRAVRYAAHFAHPDGSYAGETGSRNTCQVLPSGFEALAVESPEAAFLADHWLRGAIAGKRGYPDDDRIVCHWLHDVVVAYLRRKNRAPVPAAPFRQETPVVHFRGAGQSVVDQGALRLIVGANKGGVFRAYRGAELLHNDTGIVILLDDGTRLVSHIVESNPEISREGAAMVVRGRFHRAKKKLPTPFTQVAFRLVNATVGRLAPNLLRLLLQKVLITGKKPSALRFERRIDWSEPGVLMVSDRLQTENGAPLPAARVFGSTDATSIYVATSNLWQDASLEPWSEWPDHALALRRSGSTEIVRRWS